MVNERHMRASSKGTRSHALQPDAQGTAMFYRLRDDRAISALGVSPKQFEGPIKSSCLATGREGGLQPNEVALWMVAQLPWVQRQFVRRDIAKAWIATGKIGPDSKAMQQAIARLGL
jgi:hypothetical protein